MHFLPKKHCFCPSPNFSAGAPVPLHNFCHPAYDSCPYGARVEGENKQNSRNIYQFPLLATQGALQAAQLYKPSHQSQGGVALVGGSSSSRWGVNTMTEHKHASMQHGYIAARGRRGQGIVNLNINTRMPATPLVPRSVWKFEQHL